MSVEKADQKKEEEPVKTERERGERGRQKAKRAASLKPSEENASGERMCPL